MSPSTNLESMAYLIESLRSEINSKTLKNLSDTISKDVASKRISRQKQISNLIDAYKNENLVLVLGAGASIDYGLPSWDTLLQKLLIDTFVLETNDDSKQKSIILAKLFTEVFDSSPLVAARYLKKLYQDNTRKDIETSFEEAVKAAMYEEIDLTIESDLFKEIKQFCVAPGRSPNLDSIITYNYDNILETYLSNLDVEIPFKSIYSIGMNPAHGQLPIYHVHGFLPQNGSLSKMNKITLSEDIYHQQYNEIYSWNNIIQINKFRDNICLFIGTSLTDPNLRRLLDIAMLQKGNLDKYHYLIKKKYDLKIIEKNVLKILEQNQKLNDDKEKANLELDETVKHLVNVMEKFEENDALSFGVNTIWIKDYNEISKILKKIRKQEL